MKPDDEFKFYKGILNGLGISILLWIGIIAALSKILS